MSTQDSRARVIEPSRRSVSALRVTVYVLMLVTLGATLAVTAAGAESTGAGQTTADSATNAVVVDLDGEGDAVVETTVPFDLTDSDEQTRFEAFVGSEQRQQRQLTEYESQLSDVATDVEAQTGREMRVRGADITTRTDEARDLGVIVLRATWEGLATVDGDQLVLEQPFGSGFNADRTVVVRPPADHEVVTATPTPTDDASGLVWNGGQSLDGFQVVVEPLSDTDGPNDTGGADGPEDSATEEGGDATGPGFGFGVVAASLVAAVIGVRRRGD